MNRCQSSRQSDFRLTLQDTVPGCIVSEHATANYLSVSCRTLGRWHADGADPAWITPGGKCVSYRQSDLTAYVEANRVRPAAKVRHG